MKGVSTVIATILMLMITIALAGMAYVYLSGLIPGTMGKMISLTSATCSVTTQRYYIVVRNQDPRLRMSTDEIRVFIDGIPVTVTWEGGANEIPPGGILRGEFPADPNYPAEEGRMRRIVVTGPSNSEEKSVFC